jgi:hypothetical protein
MTAGVKGTKAPHGTITRYFHHRCRCAACRATARDYNRRRSLLPEVQEAHRRHVTNHRERERAFSLLGAALEHMDVPTTGFLVLFGSECHHAATAEEAADLLSQAGGQLVRVVNLERLGAA